MSAVVVIAGGTVECVAEHKSHPGYRSIAWRRSDNYSQPGMEAMSFWVREDAGLKVGDEIRVTVECAAATTRRGAAQ